MSSDKNMDDLLRQKLSGEAFEFKEAYWANAQKVITSQGGVTNGKRMLYAVLSVLIIIGSGAISLALMNSYQSIDPITNISPVQVKTPLTNSINSAQQFNSKNEKIAAIQTVLTNENTPSNEDKKVTRLLNNTSQFVKDKRLSNKSSLDNQRPKGVSSEIQKNENFEYSNSLFKNNRENLKLLDLIGLNFKHNSSSLLGKPVVVKHIKLKYTEWQVYTPLSFGLNGQFKEQSIGFGVAFNRSIGRNYLIGVGVELNHVKFNFDEAFTAFQENITSKINQVEELMLTEKERTIPGYIFIDGIAFNAMVEETYFDSSYAFRSDTIMIKTIDTTRSKMNVVQNANYIDVPFQLSYVKSFGKFDVRLGIGSSVGYRLNSISESSENIKPSINPPLIRIKAKTTVIAGYYLTEKASLQVGASYSRHLNSSSLTKNILGLNAGIRFSF